MVTRIDPTQRDGKKDANWIDYWSALAANRMSESSLLGNSPMGSVPLLRLGRSEHSLVNEQRSPVNEMCTKTDALSLF